MNFKTISTIEEQMSHARKDFFCEKVTRLNNVPVRFQSSGNI